MKKKKKKNGVPGFGKFRIKTGFDSGGECRWLNKNLIMYHLYKNVRLSDLLRRK